LNTLTADGIATAMLRNEKISPAYTDWLATNRWCPHTRKPRNAIAKLAAATTV